MALSDRKIRSLGASNVASKSTVTPAKYADGGGLYLLVTPKGSKLWRLDYRFGGKRKTLSFGSYPATSLADARRRRDEAKASIANGNDPSVQAKLAKVRALEADAPTFAEIADEYLAMREREGRAASTLTKKRWLSDLARPSIGALPIRDITSADILNATLRPIEARGTLETAKRLRSNIGEVFRYAIATGRAENDPTPALRGAIAAPTTVHRAAIVERDAFAGLVASVWSYSSPVTRIALQLLAILYPRPGELRMARWDEFDLDSSEWTIPAERTKMRREHRKPLPPLAVHLLRELHMMTGYSEFAFVSAQNARRPISENTLNNALRRLGYAKERASAHGFRASASSLLNESGCWNPDAIEAELGHAGTDTVRKAYHRAAYWNERVRMAEWWAMEIEGMNAQAASQQR